MPSDKNIDEEEYAKDEGGDDAGAQGSKRRFNEFDCPECNANNPVDGTFGDEDEITCNYCGQELKAHVDDDGRLRLKPS
jgi:hypothetical protein